MYERILVPLDGSSTAEAVLPQLRGFLRRSDAEVLLFHSVEVVPRESIGLTREAHLRQSEEYLSGIARRLEEDGVRVRQIVAVGSPAHSIVDVAEGEDVSLLAMTTHGRTGLARWVFGSVSEKVLRSSRIPIFVVRSFETAAADAAAVPRRELSVKNILVPLDGSDLSLGIFPAATEVARLFGARVLLLHVIDEARPNPRVEGQMKATVDRLAALDIPAFTLSERGDPASLILDLCRQEGFDLIAMATHGRSGPSRWVLGSVTEKVLRGAVVPMLVVRGSRTAAL